MRRCRVSAALVVCAATVAILYDRTGECLPIVKWLEKSSAGYRSRVLAKSMPEDLRRLAAAHGVATSYRNERREPVQVDADVVIRVLGLLDVHAATEADRTAELATLAERDRAGVIAPTVAVRLTGGPIPFHGAASLTSEDGSQITVRDELPGDLPPGWYRLQTHDGQTATLVAAPPKVPTSPATWGWMLQLYALRSGRSWGIG